MWIRGFSSFLSDHLQQHVLNDSTVVIDGHNIFYRMYQKSKLPYAFGSESDRFANYLRTYLTKFKKANVRCIFLFKGGHDALDAFNFHLEKSTTLRAQDYVPGNNNKKDILRPIFINDICFQVLDEMGFEYVITTDDIRTECIVLARKLFCPIIAFNVEYTFSPVQYIPEPSIVLDENNNLQCGVIKLSYLLEKFNLTMQNFVCFVILTDEYVFGEETFNSFFRSINLPIYKRYCVTFYKELLIWLGCTEITQALNTIFKTLSAPNKIKFNEERSKLEEVMRIRTKIETSVAAYFMNKDNIKIAESDTEWFEKGIFLKYIAVPYINLYRYNVLKAYNSIEDYNQEHSVILSIDIVKYAFDLLKNFKGGELRITHFKNNSHNLHSITYDRSIRKPDYVANNSFFENGWETIKQLNLFQHFLKESLESFNFSHLNRAPADCRLLLIAMVYFSGQKATDVTPEICSVLLSYVMLGVVSEKVDTGSNRSGIDLTAKPSKDHHADKNLIDARDCKIAWSIINEYMEIDDYELKTIFDRELMHPLVEFQYCLQQLNYLNQLCGSPYAPTIYSKTYNGTLIYKVLYSMRKSNINGYEFIQSQFNRAPTVLEFFNDIFSAYTHITFVPYTTECACM